MFNISPWFEIGKRYDRSFISVNYKYVKVSKDYKKKQTHLEKKSWLNKHIWDI